MNYNEALNYIHSLLVFGSVPGLERVSLLLEKLGNPQDELRFVHVAGTNGKGSVCTMISEVYKQAGLKTGLYTSPYIVDFRERMQICGEYIPKEDLARLCETVKNTGVHKGYRLSCLESWNSAGFAEKRRNSRLTVPPCRDRNYSPQILFAYSRMERSAQK